MTADTYQAVVAAPRLCPRYPLQRRRNHRHRLPRTAFRAGADNGAGGRSSTPAACLPGRPELRLRPGGEARGPGLGRRGGRGRPGPGACRGGGHHRRGQRQRADEHPPAGAGRGRGGAGRERDARAPARRRRVPGDPPAGDEPGGEPRLLDPRGARRARRSSWRPSRDHLDRARRGSWTEIDMPVGRFGRRQPDGCLVPTAERSWPSSRA